MKYLNILIAALLLLCLVDMPYGYYKLVRFVSMVAFGYMAYQYSEMKEKNKMVVFGALALLFQPFFPVALGRTMWNIVDVVAAILLLVNTFKYSNKE